MSYLFPNYKRKSIELITGKGTTIVDNQGKEYIDFTSGIGVMNLGYGELGLNQALSDQINQLWHMPNLYENHLQEKVAKQLACGKEYLSYFCNSGAEANEAALKLARKFTGRSQIITFYNSFHGRTYGAMSATGQASIHESFQPLVPNFTYLPFNEIEPLKEVISFQTAAVMLELIQGEGGVIVAQQEWLEEVSSLCREYGALLIIDEIQTGIGRTGTFYAYESYGIEPDIVTLAKGLGNGIPVGAMLGKKNLSSAFGPGSHGSTFGGNKLAMSVATKVIENVNQPDFLAQVNKKGEKFFQSLSSLIQTSTYVTNVRGKGLMVGIQLVESVSVDNFIDELQKNGLLVLKAGKNTIRLLPPLTIKNDSLLQGVEIIKNCLNKELQND